MERQSFLFAEKGNPVKQVLRQSEGAEPSAYRPPQKAAEQKEKAQDAERDMQSVLV